MLTEFLIKQSQKPSGLIGRVITKYGHSILKNLVFGRLNRLLFQIIIEF